MNRRTRSALAASFAFLVLLTTSIAFAAAVGTSGVIGKFEIDGNQTFDGLTGASYDWQNVPGRVTIYDPPDPNAIPPDTHFGGGAKEEDTNTWSLSSQGGPLPNKADLTRAYVASNIEGDSFLWLGFERVNQNGNGDAHVNFELNQSGATRTNNNGAVVPIRTNGDLLVTYDYGGSSIDLEIRQWSGNQTTGTWNLLSAPAGSFLSTINGAAITRPQELGGGSVNAFSFGEVGLDLTQIIPGFSLCPGFSTFNVKSRTSGSSFDSSLADLIGPSRIVTCPKPDSTLAKGVREHTADTTVPYVSSLNASPGDTLDYQVEYKNAGTANASGIQVTDVVADHQTYVDGSCAGSDSCSYDQGTKTITWNIAGPVAPGGTKDLTFQVKLDGVFPPQTTTINNTANGTASTEDAYHSNTTTVTVTASAASELHKGVREHSTDPSVPYTTGFNAAPGDVLDYQITYDNSNGNAPASNITISDTLAAHQTLVDGSCSPTCTVSGSTLSWTIAGPVNPSDPAKAFTFSVKLDSVFPAGTTDVLNTAVGNADHESEFDSNQTDVKVGAGPISSLTKSVAVNGSGNYATSVTAKPGDTLNYLLEYTDTGNAPASGVTVTDTLADHQTLVPGSCVPTCDQTGSTLTWNLGTVQPGDANAVTITFDVKLDSVFPAGTTDVVNSATCTTTPTTTCSSNETHTSVPAAPASQLVKTVRNDSSPSPDYAVTADAVPGDTIDYKIVYTNNGNAPASGVTVSDTIQQYQTFVQGSCLPDCSVSGNTISWSVAGQIQPGDANALTFTFQVKLDSVFPNGPTLVHNVAVGTSDQEQQFQSPPTTVTVTAAPISGLSKGVVDLTKDPSADPANGLVASTGDLLEYHVTYSNTGNAPASGITVTDVVLDHQTYDSCAGAPCSYDPGTRTVTWTIAGPVNPGAANAVDLTFQATLDSVFPAGVTQVHNVASGTSNEEQQPFPSNQTTVSVTAAPISVITKDVLDETTNPHGLYATSIKANPGDRLDYRISYENDGNADASNLTITDVVQARQTYVDGSCGGADCAYNDATKTITWSINGDVAPGTTFTLTFKVDLDKTFPSGDTVINNIANGTGTNETFPSNQTTVTVTAQPNLGLLKSADASSVLPGGEITYTLAYFNNGNGDASNATITENLPAGTTFVSCSAQCSGSPAGPITWTIATVPGNTTKDAPAGSVTLVLAVTADAGCQVCNVATIASIDQANGTPVSSNQVCANVLLGGPNAESSRAYGASVYVSLLGGQIIAPTPDTNVKNPNELLQLPLNPVAQVDLLRVAKNDEVTDTNAHADSVATTGKLQLLNTGTALVPKWLVSATAIQAVSSSDASGTSADSSETGTVLANVTVNGVNLGTVTQPTTINLVDPILHTTTTVKLIEELPSGAKAGVAQPDSNTFSSGLVVNAIHVTVKDSKNNTIVDVVVAHADSSAQFRALACGVPFPSVSGNGYVAGIHADETLIDPANELVHAEVGTVNLPSTGGSQDATLAEVGPIGPTANQTVLYSNTAYSHTDGTVDATNNATQSNTVSAIEKLRLLDQDPTTAENYLLTADLVKAESHSTGAGNGASSASSTGATTLVNAKLAGTDLCAALGLSNPCQPNPNTVLLGIPNAVIVFNEQIPGPSGPGVSELRVNAIHIYVLGQGNPLGLPAGADVVISSAESDVHDVGGTVTGTPAPPGPTNVIILPLVSSSTAPKTSTTTARPPLLRLV